MALIKTILETLEGKKTYIVAFVAACVTFAWQMEWLDSGMAERWLALLAALGAATLRAGVAKSAPVVLFALLASTAQAQTSDPGYASYRIWCGNGAGSCTGVAPNLVVTNVHVAGTGGASCRIAHPLTNREWRGQTVIGDREADVALVKIGTEDLDWVEFGENPFQGKPCHHYGYGGGTVLKMGSGQYTQNLGRSWYAATQSVSGDSGGGLFDEQGRLTSVNWGSTDTNGGTSVSTPVSYVVSLLARYRNDPQPAQPQRPIAIRPGRPAPKQPVQLGPRTLVDPLKEFDTDRLIAAMEQRK